MLNKRVAINVLEDIRRFSLTSVIEDCWPAQWRKSVYKKANKQPELTDDQTGEKKLLSIQSVDILSLILDLIIVAEVAEGKWKGRLREM